MDSQKKVWDKIAPEWHKFRQIPWPHVMEFLEDKKGKILDLGSGSGRHMTRIKDGKMFLVDYSSEMIKLAKAKAKEKKIDAKFKVADSIKIPYKKDFFDAAICIAVLHCMEKKEAEKTLKELSRVLKPKSKALISVWNKNSQWFKNRDKKTKMQWGDKGLRELYLFDMYELVSLIKEADFKIIDKITDKNINIIVEKP